MPPAAVTGVIEWFATSFGKEDGGGGAFVGYDPFGLQDSFGKVMLSNLAVRPRIPTRRRRDLMNLNLVQSRNLALPSAEATPTLESLSRRLVGFGAAKSLTLKTIRDRFIPLDEHARSVSLLRPFFEADWLVAMY